MNNLETTTAIDALLQYLQLCLQGPSVTATFSQLLAHYGSLQAINDSPQHGEWLKTSLQQGAQLQSDVQRTLDWSRQPSQSLLSYECPGYPKRLREIASPPPLLFAKGNSACLQRPALAIVGSRRCSPAGARHARYFARCAAQAGLLVVSGLALGIDTHAHSGALDAEQATVAVLGSAIDQVYPQRNSELARSIQQQGVLLSEFPLGTPAYPGNFPQRNRIVTGLSLGVLIVEATAKSGSLISARLAMEQNREVFALPGPVGAPQSVGCHELIRQGVKLVDRFEHITEELPVSEVSLLANGKTDTTEQTLIASHELTPLAEAVLAAMQGQPCLPDELQARMQTDWPTLGSSLQELELAGLIWQTGGRYCPVQSPD